METLNIEACRVVPFVLQPRQSSDRLEYVEHDEVSMRTFRSMNVLIGFMFCVSTALLIAECLIFSFAMSVTKIVLVVLCTAMALIWLYFRHYRLMSAASSRRLVIYRNNSAVEYVVSDRFGTSDQGSRLAVSIHDCALIVQQARVCEEKADRGRDFVGVFIFLNDSNCMPIAIQTPGDDLDPVLSPLRAYGFEPEFRQGTVRVTGVASLF